MPGTTPGKELPLIAFDNSYSRLPEHFFRPAKPAAAAQPQLIRYNQALADQLGIALDAGDTVRLAQIFSGQILPVGAEPIAMAYSGHQFGHFNPQLGDGRALLLGEVETPTGSRELQLKGSGMTPYSRRADGRAVLRSSIREFLCSEAMAALGVPTTRALCITGSRLPVRRETVETAAVVEIKLIGLVDDGLRVDGGAKVQASGRCAADDARLGCQGNEVGHLLFGRDGGHTLGHANAQVHHAVGAQFQRSAARDAFARAHGHGHHAGVRERHA